MKKFSGKSWLKAIDVNNAMNSRVLLYLLFVLSIVQLFVHATSGDFMFCIIFILVGFLTTFFSKNMIAVMTVALVVSNVLKQSANGKEGFEGKERDATDIPNTTEKVDTPSSTSTPSETKDNKPSPTPTAQVVQETSSNIKRMADIQLKMLENLSELKPVLEQSKDLLAKIKQSGSKSTSMPTSTPSSTTMPTPTSTNKAVV